MENEEKELIVVEEASIKGLSECSKRNSKVNVGSFTNITDSIELYNVQKHVDCMLNDCIGEKIRFKKALIRTYDKPLDEPVINKETGEIEKEFERKVSCILIDENGKSYATGSKTFTYDLMDYLGNWGGASKLEKEGVTIEIIKVPTESGNKALSFKLIPNE